MRRCGGLGWWPCLVVVAVVTAASQRASSHVVEAGVVEVTEANFDEHLRQGPLLLQFYADWHPVCQKFEPTWQQIAQDLGNQLIVGRVNFNEERELSQRFGIADLPTFKFVYGNGNTVDYHGGLTATEIETFAVNMLSPNVQLLLSYQELLKLAVPYSAFILFHEAGDDHSMNTYLTGIRPFVESEGVFLAHSHSAEFASSLIGNDVPQMPFVAIVKDWDISPSVEQKRLRSKDGGYVSSSDLIDFFSKHWMPLLPRIEASSQLSVPQGASLGTVIAVCRDVRSDSRFLNAVRSVALEHKQREGGSMFSFAWVEGPQYIGWLEDLMVSEQQFGAWAFVLDTPRSSFYKGVQVNQADDLRGYLRRIEAGSVSAQPIGDKRKMKQKDAPVPATLLELADGWVDALQLPSWWRPSHLRESLLRASTSSNGILYLSLLLGILLSFVLWCVNRSLGSRHASGSGSSASHFARTKAKTSKAD